MKTFFFYLTATCCLSLTANAQLAEGIIYYDVTVNLHRTLPPERAEMKNMIPEFRTNKQQLLFNSNESLYKAVIEDEEPMEAGGDGVQIRLQQPHVEIYYDASAQRRLIQEEFMGKDYLMEDSLAVVPWKFAAETRKILDYDCQKASYYDERRKQQIDAWYTTRLRPSLGPEIFTSLPGTVLMIDINDGERTVKATSVHVRPLKKNELKIPNKGIPTTRSAFQKMREEHIQRMRANGANVIIRN